MVDAFLALVLKLSIYTYVTVAIFSHLISQDGYQLAVELEKSWQESAKSGTPMDIVSSLRR
jgi:hypothetical protein